SQPVHSCDDSFARTKDCRPGDQNVGSRIDHQRRSGRIDAAINLEVTAGPDLIDHLSDAPNLWQRRVDGVAFPFPADPVLWHAWINIRRNVVMLSHLGMMPKMTGSFSAAK